MRRQLAAVRRRRGEDRWAAAAAQPVRRHVREPGGLPAHPAAPALLAYFNTWNEEHAVANGFSGAFGLDLDPARRRIYVADSIRGLLILQADPAVFP